MGGRKTDSDADRFLLTKRDVWYYQRRVPLKVRDQDSRSPLVRTSLQTKDIAQARLRRDAYEAADNHLWGSMVAGDDQTRARHLFDAAIRRAEALGFNYRSAAEIAEGPLEDLGARVDAMMAGSQEVARHAALLGGVTVPPMVLSKVYDLYEGEIATDELLTKSEQQRRKWKNVKRRAVESFVGVVGDLAIGDITRDDALKYWRFWQVRIAPKVGKPSHTPSSGNRELGSLRTIYGAYYDHLGDVDRLNPFDGLSFREKAKKKRTRPAFPTDFILDRLLRRGALAGLNIEARAILLATIETGARPSETCNLTAEQIRVDAAVPHLSFEERDDPDNPRELKSAPSIRVVPLVGVALEVFKAFPKGFPRYREKEEAASALINKFMRNNGLVPTPQHTLYGLRHSLEDRMKEAGLTDDLRRILMGHKIDREEYGTGGGLAWRMSEMHKIALPFDAEIVSEPKGAQAGLGRKS